MTTSREPEQGASGDLVERLIRFGQVLRRHDFDAGSGDVLDALRALGAVGLAGREQVRSALRAVFVRSPEQIPTFDALFDLFFAADPPTGPGRPAPASRQERDPDGEEPDVVVRKQADAGRGDEDGDVARTVAYTPQPLLVRRDLGRLSTSELATLRPLAERLARRLAMRWSRRTRPARRGTRVDLRRTMRAALRWGGDPLEIVRRRRRIRRTQLLVVCDVSGSMEPYARFLLLFVCALQQAAGHRVESFVFSTDLARVTPYLRHHDAQAAVERAVRALDDWAGGTRIGRSLERLNREYGYLVNRRSVVVILSDGLDTGDAEVLEEQMARLARRAGRIVWLNPLAGDARYEPLAVGMRTALPYVDVLAPAQTLADLLALERYL